MRIGIGIDTGGTYTDAVAYDFAARTILGSAKALTTRDDLSVGILEALDNLPEGLAGKADIISLSTTLATNACVEGRHGRAMLVLFGGDERIIARHGGEYGLPPARDMHIQECHSTFAGGFEDEVNWDYFRSEMQRRLPSLDGVGVVEVYAMRNGAAIEKEAKRRLQEMTGMPVVCGHELFSDLSVLQRGAGTLLNAGLFPIIREFIAAIKHALDSRGDDAPVVIVRSDGSLMSEEFAARRPVETLLCGPAASVIGGMELAGAEDAVVVDMGGTTTDIAVVRGGVPLKAEDGIGIGKWKTFVKGLYINSVGLGGDSAVHYRDNGLVLESHRAVPLCIAASRHPGLVERLADEIRDHPRHTRFLHEAFILTRGVDDNARYSDLERRFCDALRAGPLTLRQAAKAVDRDEYTLDVSRLVREGVVQVAGLTPTDIMHIRGDFARYDAEASRLGASFVAANLGIDPGELCDRVYDAVKRRLYLGIVKTLLSIDSADGRGGETGPEVEKLILDSFDRGGGDMIAASFRTDLALVGIGAPIHIFLDDVARLLGTRAIVPSHSGVANALGAVVGKVHASHEILVRPVYNQDGAFHYEVLGEDGARSYETRELAEAAALEEAGNVARAEAAERGAAGEITVSRELKAQEVEADDALLYLGARAVAHAVGSIAL